MVDWYTKVSGYIPMGISHPLSYWRIVVCASFVALAVLQSSDALSMNMILVFPHWVMQRLYNSECLVEFQDLPVSTDWYLRRLLQEGTLPKHRPNKHIACC